MTDFKWTESNLIGKAILIYQTDTAVNLQICSYRGILNIRYVRQATTGAKTFTKWVENRDDKLWTPEEFHEAYGNRSWEVFVGRGLSFIRPEERVADTKHGRLLWINDDPRSCFRQIESVWSIPAWLKSKMSNPFLQTGHRNAPEVREALRCLTAEELTLIKNGGVIRRPLTEEISGISAKEYFKKMQEDYADDLAWGVF